MDYITKLKKSLDKYFIKEEIKPLVSVIVPVYNVEEYVEKCLTSLVKQTLKELEIIVINDGSTDSSADIIKAFGELDSRIKVITQKNMGLSMARNTGLKAVSAEFTSFLDSDDWVDEDYYEKLLSALKRTNSDIAAASILRKRENSQKYRVHYTEEKVYTTLQEKLDICRIPVCCYVWNKLYKTELVKEQEFKQGVFFEDVLWTPEVLKKANKLVTVPNIHHYYRVNNKSIVKKIQTPKKQQDSYNAKKYIVNFYAENGLKLPKKSKTVTKRIKYLLGIPVLKTKESETAEITYLFGFLPVAKRPIPYSNNNTFFVWEPCSQSHSEVVPGYVKYLLDLGYDVSVLVEPDRLKEGLFSKFKDERITFNIMTRNQIKYYFQNSYLSHIKGVMVTTAGKLCDCINYDQCYSYFNPTLDKSKLLLVEHEASYAGDKGTWQENLITLRKLNYKGLKSIVVNPHYFGDARITPKNEKITNFITIGAIKPNKKNSDLIVNAVKELHEKGVRNFKVTVVGKGHLKHLPEEIRKYFDVKGRLPFAKMYEEIEKSDFMLTAYDDTDKEHIRYNTTGTSGNFQLVYGFLKPCIIIESFAAMNEFNEGNCLTYKTIDKYSDAMENGIKMSADEYQVMQNNLKKTATDIYKNSLENLKKAIKV